MRPPGEPAAARPDQHPIAGAALELALKPFDVAGVCPGALPQLLVGGAFSDTGQGPADGLGAVRVRLLPADDENESCIEMQDIEGNEFDLD